MNYEAIAIWRDSKNPLEQRKTNLKISPKGIVDFGTDKGYSPLDLVMAARNCDLNEAFNWLAAKLGPGTAAPVGAQVVDLPPHPDAPSLAPEQPRGYRFKLVGFNDMKPGLEQLYLVDELIPVAGLVDIWGKPKCFKSFWTLDLMFHVAMGWEYRDRCDLRRAGNPRLPERERPALRSGVRQVDAELSAYTRATPYLLA
jgi:hypothetical protein